MAIHGSCLRDISISAALIFDMSAIMVYTVFFPQIFFPNPSRYLYQLPGQLIFLDFGFLVTDSDDYRSADLNNIL